MLKDVWKEKLRRFYFASEKETINKHHWDHQWNEGIELASLAKKKKAPERKRLVVVTTSGKGFNSGTTRNDNFQLDSFRMIFFITCI